MNSIMKKTYINPRMTMCFIAQQQIIALSGGDKAINLRISEQADASTDDNRVKSGGSGYNVRDDDWNQ